MSRFTHLILTRFNLRLPGVAPPEAGWLSHRVQLFEKFCLPSVRAQSNRNFGWLLFCDAGTPPECREKLDSYADAGTVRPHYIRDIREVPAVVMESVERGSTHVITTTLDNDDALARTFVEKVQDEFRAQDFELVNFSSGFRLDLRKTKLYVHRIECNPFISLIERKDQLRTVLGCGPHGSIPLRFNEIRNIETEPLWLQVIHDRNVAPTGVWGCRRVPLGRLAGHFTLDYEHGADRESAFALGIENVRRKAERCVIDRLSVRSKVAVWRTLRFFRRRDHRSRASGRDS